MSTAERYLDLQNHRLDEICQLMEEGELTPELEAEFDDIIASGEEAILDVVRQIHNFSISINASKLWEKTRRESRKKKEERVERFRAAITAAMDKRGLKRLVDDVTGDKVRTQASQPRVECDIEALPPEFLITETVTRVDAAKLKAHLKEHGDLLVKTWPDNEEKVAARLVEGRHCVIW